MSFNTLSGIRGFGRRCADSGLLAAYHGFQYPVGHSGVRTVFVAFYADEQECWFTSFGEDLTGDLPTFYAKMPKGPTSK